MKDGGPAFPSYRSVQFNGQSLTETENQGLSLRDCFAINALTLLDNNMTRRGVNMSYEAVAEQAYNLADAMLAEREKGTQ